MILLASIHDVAPPNLPAIRRLWRLCREARLTPALLVVPDWHGTAPIEKDPEFLAWLREAVAMGAEVVLHGERHDEVGRPRSFTDNLRAMGKTAREGECLVRPCAEQHDSLSRTRDPVSVSSGIVIMMSTGARFGEVPRNTC